MQHHLGLKSSIPPPPNAASADIEDQITQDSTLYPQITRCRGKRCQIKKTKFRPKLRSKSIRRPKPKKRPKMVPKKVQKSVPKKIQKLMPPTMVSKKVQKMVPPKRVQKMVPPKIALKKPLTTVKPTERQSLNQIDR